MPRKLLDTVRGFDYPEPLTDEKQKKKGTQAAFYPFCHVFSFWVGIKDFLFHQHF